MNAIHTTQALSPELERLAQKRAGARLGWVTHATIYVTVISALALLGAHQGRFWPIAPALGWGLVLRMHGLRVFAIGKGSALRERWVQGERERLQATAIPR
jgi:hypothetical protein